MSGHSKWATIRRSKAANDSKRGKVFTKIGHEIVVAVRESGSDPDANVSLRMALDKARKANMPKDNITRAIKRGTGELRDQGEIVEAYYEGYGPHGTAIMVKTVTDNRNRAVSEIRHVFSRHGGNLGSEGCVAWMFSQKGHIEIEPGDEDPEEIALIAIDSGAEDVEVGDGIVDVYTQVPDMKQVQAVLAEEYELANSELAWIPQSTVTPGERETIQTMKLLEALEELDDVQQVYSNLDISDEMVAKYEEQAA